MISTDTTDTLNRVLTILQRSFTQYLRYARPYIPPGREKVSEVLEQLASGQDTLAERVTQAIHESGGLPDDGDFPIEYTDSHDLSIDYLLDVAIDCQRQDIADLSHYVDALRLSPVAQALASEALGMAKGNLEQLEELTRQADVSPK